MLRRLLVLKEVREPNIPILHLFLATQARWGLTNRASDPATGSRTYLGTNKRSEFASFLKGLPVDSMDVRIRDRTSVNSVDAVDKKAREGSTP